MRQGLHLAKEVGRAAEPWGERLVLCTRRTPPKDPPFETNPRSRSAQPPRGRTTGTSHLLQTADALRQRRMGGEQALHRSEALAFEPLGEKALGPNEIRIRTLFSGISAGTELSQYRGTNPFMHRRWDEARRLFVAADSPSSTSSETQEVDS